MVPIPAAGLKVRSLALAARYVPDLKAASYQLSSVCRRKRGFTNIFKVDFSLVKRCRPGYI
jgi:hypothetical protein